LLFTNELVVWWRKINPNIAFNGRSVRGFLLNFKDNGKLKWVDNLFLMKGEIMWNSLLITIKIKECFFFNIKMNEGQHFCSMMIHAWMLMLSCWRYLCRFFFFWINDFLLILKKLDNCNNWRDFFLNIPFCIIYLGKL
jgi:hypothetical protein